MKKLLFLLAGVSAFCSVAAFSGESGIVNHNQMATYNVDPNTVHTNTNPDTAIYNRTSNGDGLGNAGNTQGVGSDHGGGNGPSN